MADKHPKRPRDFSQAAKLVVDLASMDETERAALQKKIDAEKALKKPPQSPGKRTSSSS